MQRYLTTLRLFWSTSVAAEAEYRINFVLALLSSLLSLGGSLFGMGYTLNIHKTRELAPC